MISWLNACFFCFNMMPEMGICAGFCPASKYQNGKELAKYRPDFHCIGRKNAHGDFDNGVGNSIELVK